MPSPAHTGYDTTTLPSATPLRAPPAAAPHPARAALRGMPFAAQAAALAPSGDSVDAAFAQTGGRSGAPMPAVEYLSHGPIAAPPAAAAAPAAAPAAAEGSDALAFDDAPAQPAAAAAAAPAAPDVEELPAPAPPPPPTYDVDGASYRPTRQLGAGAFGRVQELTSAAPDPKKLVVKQASEHPSAAAALTNEAGIHRSVPAHPNVVASRGVKTNASGQVTDHLMEHAGGGDATHTAARLRDMYASGRIGHAELHGALQHITRGTARGLEHLAGQGIVHNDIKGDNVMLGGARDATPKISDFGIAGTARDTDPFGVGTRNYTAPERNLRQGTTKSDVYSLGQMANVMATGRMITPEEAAARQGARVPQPGAPQPAASAAQAAAPQPAAAPAPAAAAAGHQGPPRLQTAFSRFVDTTMALDPARRPDAARAQKLDYLNDPLLDEAGAEAVIARAHRHGRGEDVRKKNRPIDHAALPGADDVFGKAGIASQLARGMKHGQVMAELRQKAAARGAAKPAG
ncbi:MAG: protein kinase [Deltaproteobacteria bacterium]|nr:protein kinase [Deltaproteobacteria bacterium]